jgi:hypothetical protein
MATYGSNRSVAMPGTTHGTYATQQPSTDMGPVISSNRENILGGALQESKRQSPYSTRTLYEDPEHDLQGEEYSDISGLPFKFNPPLHNWNVGISGNGDRTRFLNQGRYDTYEKTLDHWLRESGTINSLKKMKNLRLGRISMGDQAQAWTDVSGGHRYGFRFLYNPTTIAGAQQIGPEVIPNPQEKAMLILLDGLEVITFTVLLNRFPDVISSNTTHKDHYSPGIHYRDLEAIKERGTNYDLEFLYRATNGQQLTTVDGQKTADFGLITPQPLHLTLGKTQYKGRLMSIDVSHKIWSQNMVPVLTEVGISFQRIMSLSPEDMEAYGTDGGKAIGIRDAQRDAINQRREELGLPPLDEEGFDLSGGSAYTDTSDAPFQSTAEWQEFTSEQMTIARGIVLMAMRNFSGSGPHGPDNKRAALIGLITAMQESGIRNLDHGHGTSLGVFQQINVAWGTAAQRRNPTLATQAFFGISQHAEAPGLRQIPNWNSMTVTQASHAVQRSAHPNAVTQHIPSMQRLRDHILKTEADAAKARS